MKNCRLWNFFNEERQKLQLKISNTICSNMTLLINENEISETADVILVAADGQKIAAHICILCQRAPTFFKRYIEPTLDATPRNQNSNHGVDNHTFDSNNFCNLQNFFMFPNNIKKSLIEVAVGDVDFKQLKFFIRSVYIDEEIFQLNDIQFNDLSQVVQTNYFEINKNNYNKNNACNLNQFKQEYTEYYTNNNQHNILNPSEKTDFNMNSISENYSYKLLNNDDIQNDSYNKNDSPDSLNNEGSFPIENLCKNLVEKTSQKKFSDNKMCSEKNFFFPLYANQMSASFPSSTNLKIIAEDCFELTEMNSYYSMNTILRNKKKRNINNFAPIMTSFKELAAMSPSTSSSYYNSKQNATNVENLITPLKNSFENNFENDLTTQSGRRRWKFDTLKTSNYVISTSTPSPSYSSSLIPHHLKQKIFPMFINLNSAKNTQTKFELMSQSFPQNATVNNLRSTMNQANMSETTSCNVNFSETASSSVTLRSKALSARRLSVTSLTSLNSIDSAPVFEGNNIQGDLNAASQLGSDLLKMYYKKANADMTVVVDNINLPAHRCILSANCAFFKQQLKLNYNHVELKGFSKSSVNFLLTFLYGGLTCFPPNEEVDVWEIIALSIHLNLQNLTEVAILHLQTYKCHFFHKPCATCVSAVFDMLPQLCFIKCLSKLYQEALSWQARNFARIWKGRVFLHLTDEWQKKCFNALLEEIKEENVIEVLLSCEKLQVSLSRLKSQNYAFNVINLVANVIEYCTEFLIDSYDLFIASKAYQEYGKGIAINLSLLEDILPSLIHNLSTEVSIKTFVNLRNLIVESQEIIANNLAFNTERNYKPKSVENLSNLFYSTLLNMNDFNPRFLNLNRRLFDLVDRHLLHYAASVVKCNAWNLLNAQEQKRIKEAGIFVQLKMARALPPCFSSFNRSYKRSASVNIQKDNRESCPEREIQQCLNSVHSIKELPLEQITKPRLSNHIYRRSNSAIEQKSLLPYRNESLTHIIQEKTNQIFSKIPTLTRTQKNLLTNDKPNSNCVSQTLSNTKFEVEKNDNNLENDKKNLEKIKKNDQNNLFKTKILKTMSTTTPLGKKTLLKTQKKVDKKEIHYFESEEKKALFSDVVKTNNCNIKNKDLQIQRQNTHTVMTVQQNRDAGIDPIKMGVPQASCIEKRINKPQSVVRPMIKEPPLAIAAMLDMSTQINKKIIKNNQRPLLDNKNIEKQKTTSIAIKSRSALPRLLSLKKSLDVNNEIKTNNKNLIGRCYLRSTICSTKPKITSKTQKT